MALSYDKYALFQKELAFIVCSKVLDFLKINSNFGVIDLGCGSGFIANALNSLLESENIFLNFFLGIDISNSMLQIHPKRLSNIKQIKLLNMSFDDFNFCKIENSIIVSSSALQWSKKLDSIFYEITKIPFAISLFTSNSLKELHNFLGTRSPIYSIEFIQKLIKTNFNIEYDVVTKKLYFNNSKAIMSHLKTNALLSGNLSFKKAKELYKQESFRTLTYESLVFSSFPTS